MKRKPISKRIRFEIFKRDLFTCQYCGNTPPSVILECDHINPVSKGGTNDEHNLITSCFNCNRGKSNVELIIAPKTISEKYKILQEKDLQFVEYQKLVRKFNNRINKLIEKIVKIYSNSFPGYTTTEHFKQGSIKKFILNLEFNEVEEAMYTSCGKFNADDSLKYFCGICWNKIKGVKYGGY